MSVLTEDTIIAEILPHLHQISPGRPMSQSRLVSIVQSIIYRLKTGCQWRELPIEVYFDQPYSWKSVFHHFNKWCKAGVWQHVWTQILNNNLSELDLSSAQLDGSHTPSKMGGQAVGYQGRKSARTTNMLFISDNRGVLLAASQPEKGNHHDSFNIETHFTEAIDMLRQAGISTDGLFLNADAGFDNNELRSLCYQHHMIPNFYLNKRNGSTLDRQDYFDPELYKARTVIERSFAWMDGFKALLIRYETTTRNWFNLNILGFIASFCKKKKN